MVGVRLALRWGDTYPTVWPLATSLNQSQGRNTVISHKGSNVPHLRRSNDILVYVYRYVDMNLRRVELLLLHSDNREWRTFRRLEVCLSSMRHSITMKGRKVAIGLPNVVQPYSIGSSL